MGQVVNPNRIPEICPHCSIEGRLVKTIFSDEPVKIISTMVVDYDPMWHDGKVVCSNCGGFIRSYDAG